MTDSLVSTRGRRANAGSRLKQLIELEEQRQDTPQVYIGEGEDDENVRLLFQEDGEDDEFVDEDIDNENLQGIDESEDEDDDNNDNDNDDNENDDESRKRTHDEVNDDDVLSDSDLSSSDTDEEEGEKELERQEKLKKRKMRKTVVPAIKMPSAAPKRSRPTVLVSSDSLTSSDRRSSSRRSALQNKNALIAKLQEDEERSKLNKPVVRPVEHIELTQEERLAAAVETERLNVLALNEFRQQEIVKKEKQRLMHALRRHQLVDVVRFLSRVEYVTPLEELAVVRKKLEKERSRKKGGRKKKNPQEELLEQIKKKMWLPGDVDEDLPYVQEEFRLEDEKKEREGREEKDEKEETEGKEGKDEKEDKEETEGKEVHEENGVEEKENEEKREEKENEEKIEEKDKEYEEQVNEENEEKKESLEGKENEKENGNEVNQKVGQENEQMKEINDEVNESNIEVDKNNEEQTVNDTEIKSEPVDSTVPNDPAPTTEANGTSDKTEVNNTNGTNEVNGTNDTNDKTEVPNPTSDKGHTPLPGTSSPSNTPTRTRSESRVVKAEPETEDSPGPEEPAKPVYVPRIKYNSTDTFAGPPQKVTRNNVLLVDFETYLDRTTVRKVVLGSQSVLGSSRRFKDLKPVIRIGQKGYANSMAGPEPVDEIFELAANLDESDKIFDDLKRLPRLGAQQVEDDLVEDDEQLKEMPIVIATEAPTSLYLQNNNKKACLISGKEVRYFDPSTGIPYDSVETYRVLKDIEQGIVPWYSLSEELDDLGPVELYYGNRNGVRHAKGVPEGFA